MLNGGQLPSINILLKKLPPPPTDLPKKPKPKPKGVGVEIAKENDR
jgi:hypothetical protein